MPAIEARVAVIAIACHSTLTQLGGILLARNSKPEDSESFWKQLPAELLVCSAALALRIYETFSHAQLGYFPCLDLAWTALRRARVTNQNKLIGLASWSWLCLRSSDFEFQAAARAP